MQAYGKYGKRLQPIQAGMQAVPAKEREVKKGIYRNGMSCSKREGMITGNFCGVLLCRERRGAARYGKF
ncbi:MAG: hypothetical protein ACLRMZ_21795 [Blautia marasmi]